MDIRKTVRLAPGRYVAAVSGGVDSVVMLDIVRQLPGVKLTVAHYDHGIRSDSKFDRLLVEKIARAHGLPFVYQEGKLGKNASEDTARQARYTFLRDVKAKTNSDRILTAHHLDDVLETSIHNLLRGTGRKGMASLKSVDGVSRPLLHLPKNTLKQYAHDNQLTWREDSTNKDTKYRRNYIRLKLLPKLKELSPEKYDQIKHLIKRQYELNHAIDTDLSTLLHVQPDTVTLRRHDIVRLPHAVARELVGEWLRLNGIRQFNKRQLELATISIKVARPLTRLELDKNHFISFDKKHAKLVNTPL